ncbi:hypothetical protein PCANC_08333 [Puccinia coronata f. sp. avenae]|uniref:DUF962 domain protein n=1 Tax=Puccinia coronata f. sp. avenae TaxID=200324 RepID=A0A2N5VMJ7_9BASI|nr:hypothetical protein PCANC_08333 [Puccinia coronata f. sp. avenae]PLW51225.1 hypothetical protein PCASD_00960 [Puccinia coronata f. sp. avenae]
MSSPTEQLANTVDQNTPLLTRRQSYSIFNLEDQFLFYGQYHHNPVNIIIHLVCVPLIFFTSLILAHYFSLFPKTDLTWLTGPLEFPQFLVRTGLFGASGTTYALNLATLTSLGYAGYFILLEPVAGLLYAPILFAFGHWSNLLVDTFPDSYVSPTLALWTLSWIMQFIGHGHFEKRKPALIDNLFQSIVLAVFFVWIESLFFLGYRPKLARSIHTKVSAAVAQYKASHSAPSNTPHSAPSNASHSLLTKPI